MRANETTKTIEFQGTTFRFTYYTTDDKIYKIDVKEEDKLGRMEKQILKDGQFIDFGTCEIAYNKAEATINQILAAGGKVI